MPDIPTFVEQGHKDVHVSAWFSYFAPAKTPKPIVDKLRSEFMKPVNTREVRQQLLANGMYPVGDGPEALAKTMREDIARWGRVTKAIGFKVTD